MRRLIPIILVLSIAGILPAREVMNIKTRPGHSVYLNLGIDPAFVAGAGYTYTFNGPLLNRPVTLIGEATLPFINPDFGDYQFQVGIRNPLITYKSWGILNRFNLFTTGNSNWMHDAFGISVEDELVGGYFGEKFFVGLQFGYTKFLFTHYVHTDEYRERVYQDAVDGWYWNTGGKFTTGLQGGFYIGEHVEIGLRFSAVKTEQWNFPNAFPFGANLDLNYHF
jgi:hypothetical protein